MYESNFGSSAFWHWIWAIGRILHELILKINTNKSSALLSCGLNSWIIVAVLLINDLAGQPNKAIIVRFICRCISNSFWSGLNDFTPAIFRMHSLSLKVTHQLDARLNLLQFKIYSLPPSRKYCRVAALLLYYFAYLPLADSLHYIFPSCLPVTTRAIEYY
jgi:hypothetical protein